MSVTILLSRNLRRIISNQIFSLQTRFPRVFFPSASFKSISISQNCQSSRELCTSTKYTRYILWHALFLSKGQTAKLAPKKARRRYTRRSFGLFRKNKRMKKHFDSAKQYTATHVVRRVPRRTTTNDCDDDDDDDTPFVFPYTVVIINCGGDDGSKNSADRVSNI